MGLLDSLMHCSIEKIPQLPKDPSTTTWHHPTRLSLHILPVEEPSPHSIQSPGFLTGWTSLNIQGWPNRVNSSSNSSALPTLVVTTALPSSAAPYPLTGLYSLPLWMGQSLGGWRRWVALLGLQWATQAATTQACHSITGSTVLGKMDRMEVWETAWVSSAWCESSSYYKKKKMTSVLIDWALTNIRQPWERANTNKKHVTKTKIISFVRFYKTNYKKGALFFLFIVVMCTNLN